MADETVYFQGEVIRIARKRLGITQQDLTERTGVAQSTISRLEAGKDTDPPYSTACKLAEALDLWHVALLPWGARGKGHLSTVHGTMAARIAHHFTYVDDLSDALSYTLYDMQRLRPDVCGISVGVFSDTPSHYHSALANDQGEVVTRSGDLEGSEDQATSRAHWERGEPYVRPSPRDMGASGHYRPQFLVDFPVQWGMAGWGFWTERETEPREQLLHWVGAVSRALAECYKRHASRRGDDMGVALARLDAVERELAEQTAARHKIVADGLDRMGKLEAFARAHGAKLGADPVAETDTQGPDS